jgi:demethylmenaquinone methyltransferase/2-methoxy-6-polyprenyl-1,4-benzoquinol methylase
MLNYNNIRAYLVPSVLVAWVVSRLMKRFGPASHPSDQEKPVFGSGKMFDKFAKYYDIGNRFMSLGQDQRWRESLLKEANVSESDSLLDLATGSGDVAILAHKLHKPKTIMGVDPSVEMLKVAREKADALDNLEFTEGDAQAMPQFETGSFTKITMSFGIRNVPDRMKALKEMRRVMAESPSSRLAIMEFSPPEESTMLGRAAKLFVRYVVPAIGGLITSATDEYRYLEESIFKFPSPGAFAQMIEEAGFESVEVSSHAAGVVNIYVAKPKY